MSAGSRVGSGGLSVLPIMSRDGGRGEVYLHGAQLTSWLPAGDAQERLFLSARSRFSPQSAIRGGIPVSFPQFADQGPLPSHGFARLCTWIPVDDENEDPGAACLRLTESDAALAQWPHPFRLQLRIEISARTLAVGLTVENTGTALFEFAAALHTYLRVNDIHRVRIQGLRGAHYRDKVTREADVLEAREAIAIDGEVDRVYHAAPREVRVQEPGRAMSIHTSGFPDTVIWNPGPARAAQMSDMEPDGWVHMVCVEAAAAGAPLALAPFQRWHGTQTLIAG